MLPPQALPRPLHAVLHAVVFLSGSDEAVVEPAAGDEALQYLAGYLQRLQGDSLRRVQEDMACLVSYARQEKWPKQLVQFLKTFLADYGVESSEEAD